MSVEVSPIALGRFPRNLQIALDHLNVPAGKGRATFLAKALGVSVEAARLWLAGKAIPRGERMATLATLLGVAIEWLSTGRGAMRVPTGEPLRAMEPQAEYYTLDEKELITRYRNLSPDKQSVMLRLIRSM